MTAYNCWKCPPDETAEETHVPRLRLMLLPNTRVSKNAACQKNQQLPTTSSSEGSSAKSALLEILVVFPQRTLGLSQKHKLQQCLTADCPQGSCPRPHAPTSAPARHRRRFSFPAAPLRLSEHTALAATGEGVRSLLFETAEHEQPTTDFLTFSSGQKAALDRLCQGSDPT